MTYRDEQEDFVRQLAELDAESFGRLLHALEARALAFGIQPKLNEKPMDYFHRVADEPKQLGVDTRDEFEHFLLPLPDPDKKSP